MSRVFVSIGSNINKVHNLRSCLNTLQQTFRNIRKSSVYQSAAVGFKGDDFYNLVVSLETTLTPETVNAVFFEIEKKHGRKRGKNQFVARELDLDQLLYDDLILDKDGIRLPHIDLDRYAFVLKPMAEIAADLVHPKIGKHFGELWQHFEQPTPIKQIQFAWDAEN